MKRILLCLGGLLVYSQTAFAIDAYIVAGQSNGWRLSHLRQDPQAKSESEQEPRVHYFGMQCVSEPDHSGMATLTGLDPSTMGYGLARALLDQSGGEDIVFIQYCRCGAPVLGESPKSWWPGEDPAAGETFDDGLSAKFARYIASARQQVKDELQEDLQFKGLFWHQGESNSASDKAEFKQAVRNLFGRFRKQLNAPELPIVAGHIRDLGEGPRGINAALDALAADDSHLVTVPLDDLPFEPDRDGRPNVHIARAGCHLLGARMVKALSALQLKAAVEAAGGTIEFDSADPTAPIAVDLYNGNNPLKGRGGKNDAVTDEWLARLAEFPSLKRLNLSNCAVTNAGMRHVGRLTGLEELNLTLTPVSDEGLAHLSELTELRTLGLASTQCTGSGFSHLKALRKLENVNFHYTPLDDAGLRAICEVGVSGRLWFAHTHFTDAGAKHLAELKHLRRCGIGSKEPESSGAAVAYLADLPLEELSLLDRQATPEGVRHAAQIKTLRRLDVSYAPTLDDKSLQDLAAHPALESLTIGGSTEITEAGLLQLAASRSLKHLEIRRCKNLTEAGIEQLKKANPALTVVAQ